VTKSNPNKRGTEREPFTTIDIRAVIDATPEEQAVLLAIQFLHWWLGPAQAKGLELIEAVLVNPQRPKRVPAGAPGTEEKPGEELGQISPRAIKRALARLRHRGWVETERAFKGKTAYRLAVPTLAFKDAYETVAARLSPSLRASLAQRAVEPSGQLGLSLGPARPEGQASSAQELLSNQTDNLQTQEQDPAPGKPVDAKARQDSFWAKAKAIWATKFDGADLAWPKDARGFNRHLTTELERLGSDELARRWSNCVNDPWSRPSLRAFIGDTDKWITARTQQKGGTHARPFQQPKSDWQPTQR
jgi:hypothetical protein